MNFLKKEIIAMDTGFEKASAYLKQKGYEERILVFKESTATVALAAAQVGCEEAHIAKTISFYDQKQANAILIVAAGDTKVDNKKFKAYFGFKPKMLKAEDVEAFTGYLPGGVCPFGNKQAAVFLDRSLDRFETVYPACGNAQSAVRLKIDELEDILNISHGERVDICLIKDA